MVLLISGGLRMAHSYICTGQLITATNSAHLGFDLSQADVLGWENCADSFLHHGVSPSLPLALISWLERRNRSSQGFLRPRLKTTTLLFVVFYWPKQVTGPAQSQEARD